MGSSAAKLAGMQSFWGCTIVGGCYQNLHQRTINLCMVSFYRRKSLFELFFSCGDPCQCNMMWFCGSLLTNWLILLDVFYSLWKITESFGYQQSCSVVIDACLFQYDMLALVTSHHHTGGQSLWSSCCHCTVIPISDTGSGTNFYNPYQWFKSMNQCGSTNSYDSCCLPRSYH